MIPTLNTVPYDISHNVQYCTERYGKGRGGEREMMMKYCCSSSSFFFSLPFTPRRL